MKELEGRGADAGVVCPAVLEQLVEQGRALLGLRQQDAVGEGVADLREVLAGVGLAAEAAQLVEGDAEGPDVGGEGELAAGEDLGGGPLEGDVDLGALGGHELALGVGELGQPKVADLGLVAVVLALDEQVAAGEVAVDDAGVVQRAHAGGSVHGDVEQVEERERAALVGQQGQHGAVRHPLRGDVAVGGPAVDAQELHDVGVAERLQDLGLVVELVALRGGVQRTPLERDGRGALPQRTEDLSPDAAAQLVTDLDVVDVAEFRSVS